MNLIVSQIQGITNVSFTHINKQEFEDLSGETETFCSINQVDISSPEMRALTALLDLESSEYPLSKFIQQIFDLGMKHGKEKLEDKEFISDSFIKKFSF